MAEPTKACSLTKDEIKELMRYHGMGLHNVTSEAVDRINYLNKRLMSFGEIEIVKETPPTSEETTKVGW